MKFLKYNEYCDYINESDVSIEKLLDKWVVGGSYEIDKEGFCNVKGGVVISNYKGDELPIKFGKVTNDFDCRKNNLKTLIGSPKIVGGNFNCSFNKLTTLEGAPEEVHKECNCEYNQLISLEGSPKHVKYSFNCGYNKLKSLENGPLHVESYLCNDNELTTLKKLKTQIDDSFICSHNNLKTLEGAPEKLRKDFNCTMKIGRAHV